MIKVRSGYWPGPGVTDIRSAGFQGDLPVDGLLDKEEVCKGCLQFRVGVNLLPEGSELLWRSELFITVQAEAEIAGGPLADHRGNGAQACQVGLSLARELQLEFPQAVLPGTPLKGLRQPVIEPLGSGNTAFAQRIGHADGVAQIDRFQRMSGKVVRWQHSGQFR